MKKILIPTDFTSESLRLIEYAILNFPNEQLDICLVCGYKIPLTEFGVYNHSLVKMMNRYATPEFYAEKRSYQENHPNKIAHIAVRVYTGSSMVAFQDFIERNKIDAAVVCQSRTLRGFNQRIFDVTPQATRALNEVVKINEGSSPASGVRFSINQMFQLKS